MGDVTVTGSNTCSVAAVGGLIGFSQGGSGINTSFSKGNILITAPGGGQSYGGLTGASNGSTTNVYASGNITVQGGSGVQYVGGLFGFTGGLLTNGYSVGKVTVDAGVSNVGGLIGLGNISSGRSFWDTETSGQATSAGGTNAVGMSTANMQNQTNFTSATSANGGVNPNWNFSTIWKMSTENFYPELIFDPPVGPASPCPQLPPDPIKSYYPLTLNNITAEDKVYDGTTNATISSDLPTGILPGDQVFVNASGEFNDKNVGVDKPVTVSNLTLSGLDAGKYIVIPSSSNDTTATIFALPITITADGVSRDYNGTTEATFSNVVLSGVFSPDVVNFDDSSASALFDTKDVGNGKTVTISGITLTGADANNYSFNDPVLTTANITASPITVTALGQNKVYDGNTTVQVTLSSVGVFPGDTVEFLGTANFIDKNVADDIQINVTGITQSGPESGNYTLINTTATTQANITPRPITITATGQDKMYDGTTDATVTLNASNIVQGESITFAYGSATFATVGPGINIPITVTNITTSDAAISNYTFNDNTTTIATIFGNNIPNPNPESPDYLNRIYTLQSLAAALQKPLTGCLYNSYDRPLTKCLFREYEVLNLLVIAEGIRLPHDDLGKTLM